MRRGKEICIHRCRCKEICICRCRGKEICIHRCRGKEISALLPFYLLDGNPTLGDCECDMITVSIAKCGSVKMSWCTLQKDMMNHRELIVKMNV